MRSIKISIEKPPRHKRIKLIYNFQTDYHRKITLARNLKRNVKRFVLKELQDSDPDSSDCSSSSRDLELSKYSIDSENLSDTMSSQNSDSNVDTQETDNRLSSVQVGSNSEAFFKTESNNLDGITNLKINDNLTNCEETGSTKKPVTYFDESLKSIKLHKPEGIADSKQVNDLNNSVVSDNSEQSVYIADSKDAFELEKNCNSESCQLDGLVASGETGNANNSVELDNQKETNNSEKSHNLEKEDDNNDISVERTQNEYLASQQKALRHLKMAIQHIVHLKDLLSVALEKRYLSFDGIMDAMDDEIVTTKTKEEFDGFERIQQNFPRLSKVFKTEASKLKGQRTPINYYQNLQRLVNNWGGFHEGKRIFGRLKSLSENSDYVNIFEVVKSVTPINDDKPTTSKNAVNNVETNLKVILPPELMGVAYLHIQITHEYVDCFRTALNNVVPQEDNVEGEEWEKTLQQAQNVLTSRELFDYLASETVTLTAVTPHLVMDNIILLTIHPGVQLIITLCEAHNYDMKECCLSSYYDCILKSSLQQLILKEILKNERVVMPHPASAPFSANEQEFLAGPSAFRGEFVQKKQEKSFLEKFIMYAKNIYLVQRIKSLFDEWSRETTDTQMILHLMPFSDVTKVCFKLQLIIQGYEGLVNSAVSIEIMEGTIKCIYISGEVYRNLKDPIELRDVLRNLISIHKILCVQRLSEFMGWIVLSCHKNLHDSQLGIFSSCMISLPTESIRISVTISHEPDVDPRVLVSRSLRNNLQVQVQELREVQLDRMIGKNFLEKFDILLGLYSKAMKH
ncbi:mediator of RNA polymerase II transcription subunit 17-like [Teleopsis dalmanni]|uniref:mediator of RNA polymerase II transcription subunit 17-like n=1 Tax=Teleopsis dalmanni TaxID=139649 RepID=UPI0018CE98DF|nr:mediator of RNA polymerase II transcription subunit 17-like [Teleopsis dalmanni]